MNFPVARTALIGLLTLMAAVSSALAQSTRKISLAEFEDKVRGGWAGQMIGVAYGGPTEFRYLQRINNDKRDWKPEEFTGTLDQDDLYVEMTFVDVMDRIGLDATTEQYGDAFKDSKYSLWHANLNARRLLRRGVKAPMSGDPSHNFHANDIDFQIESDFIGLMTPGLPRSAQAYAERVGHVMNYGDGVYGGVFFAAMYSAAFFEKDPRKVVETGLAALPPQSVYALVIRDVLDWSAKNEDWKKTWESIELKWDRDEACPEGALRPFNIDATLNGAYVAMGLLYGKGDFDKTIDVAMRAGQDADCNPASAGGIIGVMLGYKALPPKWLAPLPAIADQKFSYTNYSYNSIVTSTIRRAKLEVQRAGGQVTATDLIIPEQSPAPVKLEQFNPGRVFERIVPNDKRWEWKGTWSKPREESGNSDSIGMIADAAGSEVSVFFTGTGAILVGTLRRDGGLADVFLDGQAAGSIDAYDDGGERWNEGLWGRFDLPPGNHTLRVVVKGQPYPGSSGAAFEIRDLVVYRK